MLKHQVDKINNNIEPIKKQVDDEEDGWTKVDSRSKKVVVDKSELNQKLKENFSDYLDDAFSPLVKH